MSDLRKAAQQALESMIAPRDGKWQAKHTAAVNALRAALADREQEPVACSNTFGCQCPKHFASQQLEQRPKRVLTAVWRDRARRAEAQRDALLEALRPFAKTDLTIPTVRDTFGFDVLFARAAIAKAEVEQ